MNKLQRLEKRSGHDKYQEEESEKWKKKKRLSKAGPEGETTRKPMCGWKLARGRNHKEK